MHTTLTKLQHQYDQLDLNNLRPNIVNSKIFSTSVDLILKNQNIATTEYKSEFENLFENFPIAANKAEFELECSCKKFENYTYLQNYKDLVEYEVQSLKSLFEKSFDSILFVGSGPLPISSHLYTHYFPKAKITNLDKSFVAIKLAKLHFPELFIVRQNYFFD